MSESLFRRLCVAHPESLQSLTYQYRMNGDVMALCNALVYSGRLRCGNPLVEQHCLVLPNLGAIPDSIERPSETRTGNVVGGMDNGGTEHCCDRNDGVGQCHSNPPPGGRESWLRDVLNPDRRVIFLDTDGIAVVGEGHQCHQQERPFVGLETRAAGGGRRDAARGSLVNEVECALVRLLVWGLAKAGLDLGEAGVICPYRSQVHLLQSQMGEAFPSVEINTIDKYQGRDKQVVVVSFVRSNPEGAVGELLRDWRRLNVALSRAKGKLVLVGSLQTLARCSILFSLVDILKARDWVYSLPPKAHLAY
ncbi:unnamed protein product, partial [Choristocarpus tenellus]